MHVEEVHDGRMQNPHVFKWRKYPHLRILKMILQVHVRQENVLDERNVRWLLEYASPWSGAWERTLFLLLSGIHTFYIEAAGGSWERFQQADSLGISQMHQHERFDLCFVMLSVFGRNLLLVRSQGLSKIYETEIFFTVDIQHWRVGLNSKLVTTSFLFLKLKIRLS